MPKIPDWQGRRAILCSEKSKLIEQKQTTLRIRIYNYNQGVGFNYVCIINFIRQRTMEVVNPLIEILIVDHI